MTSVSRRSLICDSQFDSSRSKIAKLPWCLSRVEVPVMDDRGLGSCSISLAWSKKTLIEELIGE
jgi:hypothetical protein